MSEIGSYPKIANLGHPSLRDLFADEVLIQEKVDGSQFSFGLIYDEVRMRSKSCAVYPETPGMFALAAQTVQALKERLVPGWVYRGEFLAKRKHNALFYDRTPAGNIVLFDIEDYNKGPQNFLPPDVVALEAGHLGLECVPLYESGTIPMDLERFKTYLTRESMLGGCKVEGVVIKNYARWGPDGKPLMGKYVSEEFREKHKESWPSSGKLDVVETLIHELRTEARWHKAIQHLRDAGVIEWAPRDIGGLIREVQRDVLEEEADYIKERLYKHFVKYIERGVTGGLPEWYKALLLARQFEELPRDVQVGEVSNG